MRKIMNIQGRMIINQDMSAFHDDPSLPMKYLKFLLKLTTAIEMETGFKWRVTSFIRSSPNHSTAQALDIAPDIAPDSLRYYAVTNKSDPVLYKRLPLMRALQRVCALYDPAPYDAGIFVEPDHLHLQLFAPVSKPHVKLIKWKQPKPVYPDTEQRMMLPMTSTGYCSHDHKT